jgi:transposase
VIAPTLRIFVCREPQDLRRSFDGLALAARQVLGEDPRSGALFCFLNQRLDRIKCLWWDQSGYCLLYKRLSGARFVMPGGAGAGVRIDGEALARLLGGVAKPIRRKDFRPLH